MACKRQRRLPHSVWPYRVKTPEGRAFRDAMKSEEPAPHRLLGSPQWIQYERQVARQVGYWIKCADDSRFSPGCRIDIWGWEVGQGFLPLCGERCELAECEDCDVRLWIPSRLREHFVEIGRHVRVLCVEHYDMRWPDFKSQQASRGLIGWLAVVCPCR